MHEIEREREREREFTSRAQRNNRKTKAPNQEAY